METSQKRGMFGEAVGHNEVASYTVDETIAAILIKRELEAAGITDSLSSKRAEHRRFAEEASTFTIAQWEGARERWL